MTLTPCVFCSIIQGSSAASLLYEDEQVMAFMDIQPVNAGHLLVIPKQHAACLAELDTDTGGRLFQVGQKLAQALRQSGVPCEGVNLFLADGAAAGQDVFHVHLHVIPRFRGDGFGFRFPPGYRDLPERATLDEIAVGIRHGLGA